jgi:hypothetical protein
MPLHAHTIPPFDTRHNLVGKPPREVGDPVAVLKEMTRFVPVPVPAPAHLSVPLSIFDPHKSTAAEKAGKLVFHCVGDSGGINGTATQESVANAMEEQRGEAADHAQPAFCYHLGDVVYFNGLSRLYKHQFYEPYQYYRALIFAIPGNHDGDTNVRKGDTPDDEPSLTGFLENFCDATPQHVSPYRQSMTQPYVHWTLDAPFVTIIGLYSNVEGSLDARGRNDQQRFLEDQMKAASPHKKLLLAVHHPPFSLDSAHGGTPEVLAGLDRAIQASGRVPDAVLSGHVHNYQRFERDIDGRTIPYVVSGAGGYANDPRSMHKLQKGIAQEHLPFTTRFPGLRLMKFNQTDPGFLRVSVTKESIEFEYFVVPFDDSPIRRFDAFTA